jgi:hypothetical protein
VHYESSYHPRKACQLIKMPFPAYCFKVVLVPFVSMGCRLLGL